MKYFISNSLLFTLIILNSMMSCNSSSNSQEEQKKTQVYQDTIIHHKDFLSKNVAARHVEVWLPKSYQANPDKKFAVLYMHDGQNVFNPETSYGKIAWEADSVAQSLMDKGEIKDIIIVGVWNSPKRFFEYFPEKSYAFVPEEEKKRVESIRQSDKNTSTELLADEYLKFLVTELKPFIDKNYRTLPDAPHTFIAGSSMGGLISMYAICEYPSIFGGAACLSTHWPVIYDNQYPLVSEGVRKYMNEKLPSPENHKIYFDFGTATLDSLYEVHQIKVDTLMHQKGYTKGKNWQTLKFENAKHNEADWKIRLHLPLKFLVGRKE